MCVCDLSAGVGKKSVEGCVGAYACDKERTVLCCEYCDGVNLRNVMELFGKKALGNGGGSGIKQDVFLVVGQEP